MAHPVPVTAGQRPETLDVLRGCLPGKRSGSRVDFRTLLVTVMAVVIAIVLHGVDEFAAAQSKKSRTTGTQDRPSAFVLGRVVDATTRQPIANARVSLSGRDGGRGQETVLTNGSGYFLFRDLAAGTVTLTAKASGYLDGGFGQRVPGGRTQPLAVRAQDRRGDVLIALFKAASVSGVITDDRGDAVAGVSVSLLSRERSGDHAELRSAGGPSSATLGPAVSTAVTDISGAYEFPDLHPGDYLVAIASTITQLPASLANADAAALDLLRTTGSQSLSGGMRGLGAPMPLGDAFVGSGSLAGRLPMTLRPDGVVVGFATTFYPAASSLADATPVTLAVGEDRPGINIRLRAQPLQRVAGRLSGPDGPLAGWSMHLLPAYAAESMLERSHASGTTATSATGDFSFVGVPPGDYVIKAWRVPSSLVIGTDPLPTEPTLWARVPVTVGNRPVSGVDVTVRPGSAVRGRIVLDGTAAPPPPARFQTPFSVAFEPPWTIAFAARLSVRVNQNLEFVTHGLPPGRYPPNLPNQFTVPGWFFESITRGDRDLMVAPLVLDPGVDADGVVVTYADRRTALTGVVLDGSGRPHARAAVVVFPAEFRSWLDHELPPRAAFETVVSDEGTFSVEARPGEYMVAAIDESRLGDWRRGSVVTALAGQATRVKIVRGDNAVPNLRVVVLRGPKP